MATSVFSASESKQQGVREPVRRFDRSDCLLESLERVLETGRPAAITVPDNGSLWIDSPNRLCSLESPDPERFFSTPASISEVQWNRVPPDCRIRRPIEEALWQAAYFGSSGALLQRCQPFDVVQLNSWPNLTRLPHAQSMIQLCVSLAMRPASLSFAYRSLKISQADAFQFYSAARAAGLVRVISAQPAIDGGQRSAGADDTSRPVAGRVYGFWSNLVQRLAGL